MALQIWLPLNGDTNNLGLAYFYPAAADITYTESGKIGAKCYANGTITMSAEQTASIFNNNNLTIAFWIKPTNAATPHIIFGNDTNRQFSLFQYSGNTTSYPHGLALHWDWRWEWASGINYNSDGTTSSTTTTWLGNAFSENEWSHVCVAYQRPVMKIYINGILKATRTRKLSTDDFSSFSYTTNLLTGQSSSSSRNLNDLRVYDHCLSSNEVKILSQGLVAHYKLEGLKLTNMIPSMETAFGASSIEYTKYSSKALKLTGVVNSPEITKTSNVSAPLTNGHKYYVRYETYQENAVGGSEFFWPIIGGYSFSQTSTAKMWNVVSSTFTRNYASGNYNYRLDFNNGNKSGVMWFDGAILIDLTTEFGAGDEPSKEWCDINIPYFTGTLEFINTTDSSGYFNDGVASAPFTFSPDTKRYKTSTIFKDNKYINCGRGAMVTDALTVSGWFYSDNWDSVNDMISCAEGGGWDFWPNGDGKMTIEVRRNGNYSTAVYPIALENWPAGWHHIAGTYDGYRTEIYVDGNKGNTGGDTGTTKYPITYHTTNALFIGAAAGSSAETPANKYFTGKMSDVRIYATALSTEDIKRLYQTPISLSKSGTLNAIEYIEHDDTINNFQKTGIVSFNKITDYNLTSAVNIDDWDETKDLPLAEKMQIFANRIQSTDFIEW